MGEQISLRFRHTQGDIGPLTVPLTSTVQALKERLFNTWPKDGPLSEGGPNSPGDLRLILNGKFLESAETLEGLKPQMGELKSDTVVTVHVIVRISVLSKTLSGGKLGDKDESSGCACSIM